MRSSRPPPSRTAATAGPASPGSHTATAPEDLVAQQPDVDLGKTRCGLDRKRHGSISYAPREKKGLRRSISRPCARRSITSTAFYAGPRRAWSPRACCASACAPSGSPLPGRCIVDLGYASPLLRLWRAEAARCIALMPRTSRPGAGRAKHRAAPRSPRKTRCPFPTSFSTTVSCSSTAWKLQKIPSRPAAQSLAGAEGQRKAAGRDLQPPQPWAQLACTPVGHGHPFSMERLEALLRQQNAPRRAARGSPFRAPLRHPAPVRSAEGWERIGPKLFPRFAGLTLVEAEKDMFAALPVSVAPASAAAAAAGDGGDGNSRQPQSGAEPQPAQSTTAQPGPCTAFAVRGGDKNRTMCIICCI